jgi:hypothetical protein
VTADRALHPIGHPKTQHGHNQELKRVGFANAKNLVACRVEKDGYHKYYSQPGYLQRPLIETGLYFEPFHGAAIIDFL